MVTYYDITTKRKLDGSDNIFISYPVRYDYNIDYGMMRLLIIL